MIGISGSVGFLHKEKFLKYKDGYVVNYGLCYIKTLEDMIKILNNFLLVLKEKEDFNKELLETIELIIEEINNINHFVLDDLTPNYFNEVKEKINSFKYKKIDEIELKDIKTITKLKLITEESQIDDSYCILEDDGYADGGGELILGDKEEFLFGLLEENNIDLLIENYKEIIMLFSFSTNNIVKNQLSIDYWTNLEIGPKDIPLELIHALNYLLNKLKYLLNSTSFRSNCFFIFDKIEVNNDTLKEIFNNRLDFIKSIVNYD